MKVTGNTSDEPTVKFTEKFECAVCGRDGFVRMDANPPHVAHPYGTPCMLPPKPPVVKVNMFRKVVTHTRANAA